MTDSASTTIDQALLNGVQWRLVGPFRGGRCVAVAGHPTDNQVFYMGTTGGGVWQTRDGGISWQNCSDGFFQRASVGAIAVSPSDPNVIYAGMGESTIRGNVSHGDGVYRSSDGGESWTHCGLAATRNIGKVRVHPTDPDRVYVAALGHAHGPNPERGIYRSTDGGRSWDLVLRRNEDAGGIDLAIDLQNPRVIYAALWKARRGPHFLVSGGEGSGLFKSTDGGDSWIEITANKGLPKGTIGKIGVAPSPAQRGRVWAIVEAEEGGVFRSDDGGKTWERTNEDRNLRQRAWYYTHIIADPQDAETVWVLNVQAWKSVDGGKTFAVVGIPHGDNHDLWIDPRNPSRMIEGNDGGATISFNGGLSWSSLYNQPTAEMYHVIADNQRPYRLYGAQQDNTTVSVPSKSNIGAITNGESFAIGGGESGYIAVRPDNPDIVYAGSYLGYITRFDRRTGQARNIQVWPEYTLGAGAEEAKYRFQWTAPIVLSPHDDGDHDHATLYITGNHVFRTRDEGVTWEMLSPDLTRNDPSTHGSSGGPITKDNTGAEYYGTIFAFAESPHERGVFWAGSDDGLIHLSHDGGDTWQNVTPPDDLLPEWALISIIEPSPHDPATVYVAATRYKLDDFTPYLLKSSDYGESWQSITAGLPDDEFTRTIREDPEVRGLLYCGSEAGVWVSFNDGAAWQSLRANLPVVPVHDLVVQGDDLVAGTHGRSIWILDDLSTVRQLATAGGEIAPAALHLFAPRPGIRYVLPFDFGTEAPAGTSYLMTGATIVPYQQRKTEDDQPDPRHLDSGQNPPYGVIINYFLAEETEETLTLSILDAAGKEVKSFRSKGSDEDEKAAKERGDKDPRLPRTQGTNRFVWNMHYADPEQLAGDTSMEMAGGVAGPVAPPGDYRVRLALGETTLEQPVRIVPDPRTTTTADEFAAQFALELAIRDKISATNGGIKRLRQAREDVERWMKRAEDQEDRAPIREAAKEILERLQGIEDELIQHRAKGMQDTLNYPVKLNAKLAFLAGVVASGDGPTTGGAQQVYDDLAARVDEQLRALDDLCQEGLVSFNGLIASHRLPALAVLEEERP